MAKSELHKKKGNNELNVVEPLANWYALNDALMTFGEKEAEALLQKERDGLARERFMKRIHSRLNRLRAERERGEIRDDATTRIAS